LGHGLARQWGHFLLLPRQCTLTRRCTRRPRDQGDGCVDVGVVVVLDHPLAGVLHGVAPAHEGLARTNFVEPKLHNFTEESHIHRRENHVRGGRCWLFDRYQLYGRSWLFGRCRLYGSSAFHGSPLLFNASVSPKILAKQ